MNIINHLDNLAIPLTRIKEVAMSDIAETKVSKPNRPLYRNKFIVEMEKFLMEALKSKGIEVPDASEPLDIDLILRDIDEAFAKD
jgi:hypothetical protein